MGGWPTHLGACDGGILHLGVPCWRLMPGTCFLWCVLTFLNVWIHQKSSPAVRNHELTLAASIFLAFHMEHLQLHHS